MLLDYLERELQKKARIVYKNAQFAVVIPFWAVWPFVCEFPYTAGIHQAPVTAESHDHWQ